METITLGGGCFWCIEAVFNRVEGVESVKSGYAGGETPDPTYRSVCAGGTGHAEVVQVRFDPDVRSLEEILEVFFEVHDPTTPNRQGADVGEQYRSIILADSADQLAEAKKFISNLEEEGRFSDPVVTQVEMLESFYPAEEYHDDYFERNQGQPYCNAVIAPKVRGFMKKRPELLRDSGD